MGIGRTSPIGERESLVYDTRFVGPLQERVSEMGYRYYPDRRLAALRSCARQERETGIYIGSHVTYRGARREVICWQPDLTGCWCAVLDGEEAVDVKLLGAVAP